MAKVRKRGVLTPVPNTVLAPVGGGCASQAEDRVVAGEERDPGAALRDPQASSAPHQAGFLTALIHFQAWFASGEKPPASGSRLPCSVGEAGVPRAPHLMLDLQCCFPCGLPKLACLCQALSK